MSKHNKHTGRRTESVAKVQNKKNYSRLKYDQIEELCLEAKKYNEMYRKKLSFAEYTQMKRSGKLEYPPPTINNSSKDQLHKKHTESQ